MVADSVNVGGEPMFVFWKTEARAAMAHRPVAELPGGGTRRLEFRVEDGEIVDWATGSTWTLEGLAASGPLEGAELRPVPKAYPAFWFSGRSWPGSSSARWGSAAERPPPSRRSLSKRPQPRR